MASSEKSERYSVRDIRRAFKRWASPDDWGVPAMYEDGLIDALRGKYDQEPADD